uniref:Exportin-2 n=1 Tax=Rhabditophanes sp. KR3021 TaxID=114890 RepID=A0AC35TMA6_9BILA
MDANYIEGKFIIIFRLAEALNFTLSPNAQERNEAETKLAGFSEFPGLCDALLKICDSATGLNARINPAVVTCASVFLKNFVKVQWGGNGNAPLDMPEREAVRKTVFETLFKNPDDKKVRDQLLSSLVLIAKTDFPVLWPSLATDLSTQLEDGLSTRSKVALMAMAELFNRYRYEDKSDELWKEIIFVLEHCSVSITKFFIAVAQAIVTGAKTQTYTRDQFQEMFEHIYYCAEIFLSLNSQDLPEYFEDNLAQWMNAFIDLMNLETTFYPFDPKDEEEPYNKLRVTLCEIFTLFSQKYEEEYTPFLTRCVELIWAKFFGYENNSNCDSLINSSMHFLSAICVKDQYKEMFVDQNVLNMLINQIVVKNMMLLAEDVETFEDDPVEYLKKDLEGDDSYTKRRGASDLLKALSNRFPTIIWPIMTQVIQDNISTANVNMEVHWKNKELVFAIVTALLTIGGTEKKGVTKISEFTDLNEFYRTLVRPELVEGSVNAHPVAKCAAMKFVVAFRHQLDPNYLLEVVSTHSVVRFFESSYPILHWYAGNVIDTILTTKKPDSSDLLFQGVDINSLMIINSISAILEKKETSLTPYVIKALMRVFNFINEETAGSAGDIINALARLSFEALKNSANPLYIHYIFECMSVLIRKAYVSVSGGMDKAVLPIIEHIFTERMEDFIPYALQLSALLIQQCSILLSRGINVDSSAYHGFIQFVLQPELWTVSNNISAGVITLEAYIKAFPDQMFTPQNIETLLKVYSKLMNSKANDNHAFTLANALLPYLNRYPNITVTTLFTPIYQRLSKAKTFRLQKNMMIFVSRFIYVVGADQFINSVNEIQAGLADMTMSRIFALELQNIAQMTDAYERKVIIVGMTKFFETHANTLGESIVPIFNGLVNLVVVSAKNVSSTFNPDDELALDEEAYNNKMCRLSSIKPSDDVFKNITLYRRKFAEVVFALRHNGVNFGVTSDEKFAKLAEYAEKDV